MSAGGASRSWPAYLRRQQGTYALYWPWPSWTLCVGCTNCGQDLDDKGRPLEPCRLVLRRHPTVTRHKSLAEAQAFAILRGMGVLAIEE